MFHDGVMDGSRIVLGMVFDHVNHISLLSACAHGHPKNKEQDSLGKFFGECTREGCAVDVGINTVVQMKGFRKD